MNRKILWKVCLVLLPAIAVSIACVPGTVIVWGDGMETPLAFGYFDMLPEGAVRLATPFAATMAVVSVALAVIYAVTEKNYWRRGVAALAFIAMLAAVLPYLVKTELHAAPNVLFPVLTGIECLTAHWMGKKDFVAEKRLKA